MLLFLDFVQFKLDSKSKTPMLETAEKVLDNEIKVKSSEEVDLENNTAGERKQDDNPIKRYSILRVINTEVEEESAAFSVFLPTGTNSVEEIYEISFLRASGSPSEECNLFKQVNQSQSSHPKLLTVKNFTDFED
ncbi:hypothetical protein HK099_007049 [Clydaea vesicula]|uniref:Uncharacterized protein n=1 Tax=Clydaea vesicula TaxID=447962 RepID=A0AAD5TWV4_9FUNG|nr:hypothetical protein HK099_007049 [Clydaea vesicula]KAJ3383583.1 hypothetical protein HDU92_004065 [Lobulomyces angularis]